MSVMSFDGIRLGPLSNWIRRCAAAAKYLVWLSRRRQTIKMLRSLDDHQLRDIGLRRDQLEAAINDCRNPDIVRLW
jgi:uncharacterized protein YjiS (DUF1127 family)